MSLQNCKSCGALYVKAKSSYCSQCQSIQDSVYMQVRDYVKRNPNSTVLDIHMHTGIPIAKLLELNQESFVPFGK